LNLLHEDCLTLITQIDKALVDDAFVHCSLLSTHSKRTQLPFQASQPQISFLNVISHNLHMLILFLALGMESFLGNGDDHHDRSNIKFNRSLTTQTLMFAWAGLLFPLFFLFSFFAPYLAKVRDRN
jgi:hypothetical protein